MSHVAARISVAIVAIVLLTHFMTVDARGVPRYSARYNRSCDLCHLNPTGGGMRTLYGAQFFAYTELAVKRLSFDEIERVKPMLSEQLQVGTDLRTMYHGTEEEPSANSFVQMQGDLYVNYEMSPRWSVYYDKGLYGGFEAFGLGHVLPQSGYLKVGRFYPPYGMRVADHRSFVRERFGFGQRLSESGVEIGFHPQLFSTALALTNGSSDLFDDNETKALTGRADVRFPLSGWLFWLGATGRWNGTQKEDEWVGGGFGGISIKRLTVLAEMGIRDIGTRSVVSFFELALLVKRGVTVRLEHGFLDPDIELRSRAENMFVIGTEIVPTGFLQVISNIRYHDKTSAADTEVNRGAAAEYFEGDVQLHLFF